MKRILPFLIILSVLGVALGSAWYLKRASTTTPPPSATGNTPRPNVPSLVAPGAEPPHTMGPATAPVKLEEFGDFECPPCGQFHPILKKMHDEFGDRLQITFREFPLTAMHPHAVSAASAAEAAGLQGKFWEMHHMLYDNQKTWHEQFDVRPTFEDYAKQIGIDVERFKREINGDLVARRITEDGKRARSFNVGGTPTLFMNGREMPFDTIINEDKFRAAIKQELESVKR
jgi:formate-nitrite transporter family protein